MDGGTHRGVKEGYCALCYAKAKDLRCAKCKLPYCSPECQEKDWKLGHKGDCGLADLPAPKAVPSPDSFLLKESVQNPIFSESEWKSLVESSDSGLKQGPPRGLRNLGNTCYLNAVLQGLYHSAPTLLAASREHHQQKNGSASASTSSSASRPSVWAVASSMMRSSPSACGSTVGCFRCDLEGTLSSCLDPHPPNEEEPFELRPGDQAMIKNLGSAVDLNGREALILGLDGEGEAARFMVRLMHDGRQVKIRPTNLHFLARAATGPANILRWLPKLGEFNYGSQEDAHEMLRSLLRLYEDEEIKLHSEALQKKDSAAKVETNVDLTGAPSRLFCGLLVSTVQCTSRTCGESKFSFEAFLDLSLDITEATETVEEALRLFTSSERLDKENGWRCETCDKVVRARKRMTIYAAPSLLVLQLKRFRFVETGARNKVTKPVKFEASLNLRPFLWRHSTSEAGKPLMYELRAIVVHVDKAGFSHFGHYIAYVRRKAADGAAGSPTKWYLLDDCQVVEVPEDIVMRQQAYLLFYARAGEAVGEAPRRVPAGGETSDSVAPDRCRGRNGTVCSYFAVSQGLGLCSKCYQEEHGRPPPAGSTAPAAPATGGTNGTAASSASGGYPAAPKAAATAPVTSAASGTNGSAGASAAAAAAKASKKVGANDKCPCGSGLKYKKCHGK